MFQSRDGRAALQPAVFAPSGHSSDPQMRLPSTSSLQCSAAAKATLIPFVTIGEPILGLAFYQIVSDLDGGFIMIDRF